MNERFVEKYMDSLDGVSPRSNRAWQEDATPNHEGARSGVNLRGRRCPLLKVCLFQGVLLRLAKLSRSEVVAVCWMVIFLLSCVVRFGFRYSSARVEYAAMSWYTPLVCLAKASAAVMKPLGLGLFLSSSRSVSWWLSHARFRQGQKRVQIRPRESCLFPSPCGSGSSTSILSQS
jgi:hypothetical protein